MSATIPQVNLSAANAEELKPIDFARRWWFPRRDNNKPTSAATVHRWAREGVHGVKLAVLYTTDGAVTSEAACREFQLRIDQAKRQTLARQEAAS